MAPIPPIIDAGNRQSLRGDGHAKTTLALLDPKFLGAPIEGGWPAQARVLLLLGRHGGGAPTIALHRAVAAAIVVGRRGEGGEVPVVGGKLGGPDAVGGGRAAERAVEAPTPHR